MYSGKEIIKPESSDYQIKRSGNYALHSFDFERLIIQMKHDRKWKNGDINMMVLLSSPVKKIVLVVLHCKSGIISNQVDDSIDFRIIEGKLELHFLENSFTLINGELLKLIQKTRYRIDAIEETAFLMILKSNIQCN